MSTKQENTQKPNVRKMVLKTKQPEKVRRYSAESAKIISFSTENIANVALSLAERGKIIDAKKILYRLATKNHNHPNINFATGVLCLCEKKYDESIPFFKKAIQHSPDFEEAYYNLGLAYQKQAQISKMVFCFRKVIELDNPGSELVEKAIDILNNFEEHVRQVNGIDLYDYIKAESLFNDGVELMRCQKWTDAINAFQEALSIQEDNAPCNGNIGICYAHIGNKRASLRALDTALMLDPDYELALVNRLIVENLKEGNSLPAGETNMVNYYRDYPMKKRSYIQELSGAIKNLIPNIA